MKNFTNLTYNESMMVLGWRNHKRVRTNMLRSNTITEEEHLDFIKSLKTNNTKQYFLIDDIGVIYFTNINNNIAEIGLYSNPMKFGVGNKLMEHILSFTFDILQLNKLKLEVFEENKRAINLYKKYNFQDIDTKIINKKQVSYMELENENR